MTISMSLLTGAAINDGIDDIATLRLNIFREYPYLYEGCRNDEINYLRTYVEASDSCVILVYDSGTIAGAITGMPLCHEGAQMREAFAGTAVSVDELYYIGEILLYPAYRNKSLGLKLFEQMESHIRSLGPYNRIVCATVERPDNHPLRPANFTPITKFLARTGFRILPAITTHFTWCETDGIERNHSMQFWFKELT